MFNSYRNRNARHKLLAKADSTPDNTGLPDPVHVHGLRPRQKEARIDIVLCLLLAMQLVTACQMPNEILSRNLLKKENSKMLEIYQDCKSHGKIGRRILSRFAS
jgi:hypothetical protein